MKFIANLVSALTLWAIIIVGAVFLTGLPAIAEDAPSFSFSFLQNPEILNAVALMVAAIYAAFKGTEFYQARAGLKQRAFAALAETAVASVWHNFLRGRLDKLAVEPSTNDPSTKTVAVANAKAIAHGHAADMLLEQAKAAGLAAHPAIRAAVEKNDKSAIDAAIVQAVKRFKTGHSGYTAPTTKGAL